MKNSISVMPPAEKRIYNIFFVVIAALYAVCSFFTEFSPLAVLANLDQFWLFLSEDFFPPQFPTDIRMYNILDSVAVTIAMAISSTTIAGILAFFTALVWAFILFSSLGIGTGVGFAALLITSFAFMVRAFTETMEDISVDCLESLEAVGAGFWQRVAHGIVPSCISGFLAWFLYCIEVNVRASTIVGMVGGGGVGMVLFSYIKSFNYHMAFTVILIIAAVVILVDRITGKIRKELEQ